MNETGKSLQPKRGAIMAAVAAGVVVAVLVGVTVNSSVPRNVFPPDVVHPERSGNVIIPHNASDPNANATFLPKEIHVVLGVNNTVIWENQSSNPERVIGAHENMPGGFGTIKSLIPPGGSWAFTFTEAGSYDYLSDIHPWLQGTVVVQEPGNQTEEPRQATVYYGYYNVGSVVPCIVAEGGEPPSIEIYAENTDGPDAVVDFTLTAKKNADVSLEAFNGFQSSVTKRLTVLEGTQTYRYAFYVKPNDNADHIQLVLNAQAIDPSDTKLTYTLPFSSTVVFFKDESGNYCRELQD